MSDDDDMILFFWLRNQQLAASYYAMMSRPPFSRDFQRIQYHRQFSDEGFHTMSVSTFNRSFRMTRARFQYILDILSPRLMNFHVRCPIHLKLAVTLRYLAGGSYLDLFEHYGLGLGSFYEIIHGTIDSINASFNHIIQFPDTHDTDAWDALELLMNPLNGKKSIITIL